MRHNLYFFNITEEEWKSTAPEDIDAGDVWDYPDDELLDIINGNVSDEDVDTYGVFKNSDGEMRIGEIPGMTPREAIEFFGRDADFVVTKPY